MTCTSGSTGLIIIDERISEKAKERLRQYGELLELSTRGLVYEAISGHPDIFFTQIGNKIIVAPNLPERIFLELDKGKIVYKTGKNPVGPVYPETARYNAVATETLFIHNLNIAGVPRETISRRQEIHVNQGYTRCNLIPLGDNHFITSDRGIESTLKKEGFPVLFVSPEEIRLPGFRHGFFPGACGVLGNRFFVNGSLDFHPQKNRIRDFLHTLGYKVVELDQSPILDCGGILLLPS
jgi:hypothetical protein